MRAEGGGGSAVRFKIFLTKDGRVKMMPPLRLGRAGPKQGVKNHRIAPAGKGAFSHLVSSDSDIVVNKGVWNHLVVYNPNRFFFPFFL